MRNFAKTSIFVSKEQVASKYGSYEGVLVKFFLIYLSHYIVHETPFRCMDSATSHVGIVGVRISPTLDVFMSTWIHSTHAAPFRIRIYRLSYTEEIKKDFFLKNLSLTFGVLRCLCIFA